MLHLRCKCVDACDAAHVSLARLPWTKLHTGFISLYCFVLHNSYYGQMTGRCNSWLTFGAALRSLSLAPSVTALPSAHIHSEIQDATEKNDFRCGCSLNVLLPCWFCCTDLPLSCFILKDQRLLMDLSAYLFFVKLYISKDNKCIRTSVSMLGERKHQKPSTDMDVDKYLKNNPVIS